MRSYLYVGDGENALPIRYFALEPVAIDSSCQCDQFALVQRQLDTGLSLEVVLGTCLTLRRPLGGGRAGAIAANNLQGRGTGLACEKMKLLM